MFEENCIETGWVVSGPNALFQHNMTTGDYNVIVLECTELYNLKMNDKLDNTIYVLDSNPDEVINGYACWQKALLDLMAYPYDDSMIDYAMDNSIGHKEAVEWIDYMNNHPGYWEFLHENNPNSRWEKDIKAKAGV